MFFRALSLHHHFHVAGLTLLAAAPPAAKQIAAAPAATPDEKFVLGSFEVSSPRECGHRETNAVTATRIGAEIKQIPRQHLGNPFFPSSNLFRIQSR